MKSSQTNDSKDNNVPQHVAIIMDGNGRWAKKRGLPRTMGHRKGAEAIKRTVEHAARAGIKYLTFFGFSSENWNRPKQEINDLMGLLRQYLQSQTAEFHQKNAKLCIIGNRSAFDDDIVGLIKNAEDLTKDNDGIHVIIALNYGGKNDIAFACSKIIDKALEAGQRPNLENIEAEIANNLMTANIPDPDLLIRTSGEQRISNFLLWQCAYSEMVFTPTLWPDFNKNDLEHAINDYANRDRRFGGLKSAE